MSFSINLKITFTNVIKKLARKFLTISQTVEGTDADFSLCFLPLILPPLRSSLHRYLLGCLPWDGDSWGKFEFGQEENPSGYWRAGGGKCRVFIIYSSLLQHHISGTGGISPHLYLPKGSLSFMAAALTTYSPSFPITPLLPLHPICSDPAPHRGSSCLFQLPLLAVLTCLEHCVLYLH